MKDHWWFPGGRLVRDERIIKAVDRIVQGETGVTVCRPSYLGYDETLFEADPFDHGEGTHTVNFVYAANISHLSMMKVVLDGDHLDHGFFTPEEIYTSDMHSYVKKFTAMSEGVLKQ
jgi:ADP-ribose pyrophosphatase YjhB (NUDIX family)